MKVFEKTIKAIKEFDETMRNANMTFQNERKEIMDTYKNPEKKVGEARDRLTYIEAEQKQRFRDVMNKDFADAVSKLNTLVSESIPADFPATLEVVRASGRNITEYEARAIMDKYKSSYLAYRTIVEVLQQNGKLEEVFILKPDKIMSEIQEVRQLLEGWIRNYSSGNDYMTVLFKNHTNPLTKLANRIQVFLDGGYDVGTN